MSLLSKKNVLYATISEGEEPYDAARGAFINRQLEAHCKGTDKALSMLRKKYAANKTVLGELADYETTIEAPE